MTSHPTLTTAGFFGGHRGTDGNRGKQKPIYAETDAVGVSLGERLMAELIAVANGVRILSSSTKFGAVLEKCCEHM